MIKNVNISMNTKYDSNNENSNDLFFFTEAEMEKTDNSYIYTCDPTTMLGVKEEVRWIIEIGSDFVSYTVFGEFESHMKFKKDTSWSVPMNTPLGILSLTIYTKKIEFNLENGYGELEIDYSISLSPNDTTNNKINIKITKA